MIVEVGLTGGLATGKSYVGQIFGELGCYLIEADRLGHQVLERGGEAYAAVVDAFGVEILRPDGAIDRRALASQVFNNQERLERLNAIVHPAVEQLRKARVLEIATRNTDAIVVYEAAIIFEHDSQSRFHATVLTVCGREQQIQRAMARSGWSRGEAEARIGRQWSDEAKRKLATFVIDTSGSFAETRQQTAEVYNRLKAL